VSFVLSKRISEAYNGGGFVGSVVYGPQRMGKSSYALQVLNEVYGNWNDALNYCLFSLEDVVKILRKGVMKDVKIPALVWDDAGVHAHSFLYFSNRRLVEYLSSLLDVVGTHLGGLLITTPNPQKLLKVIRGYEFFRVKVFKRNNSGGRRAVGYFSSLLPSGTRIIRRVFSDFYDVQLPDSVWNRYSKKRKKYLDFALANLEQLIKYPGFETP
jgi:hypothetical protein